LGNPVAATPATFHAAVDDYDECSKLNDKLESGAKLTWNGLF
jgi:hypothetical protein